eukprot:scaffold28294_cov55-Phaeocystis_antarctica.AAC.1
MDGSSGAARWTAVLVASRGAAVGPGGSVVPHPWPSHPWPSHLWPTHLAQPCPSSIAVASRFVALASPARSYLRSCPPRAVPVRCRPTVWWLCFYCGRCIEFVMLLLTCCSTPCTGTERAQALGDPLSNFNSHQA